MTGIRTIRNVTNDLRPSLLDDLGLLPALRSLAAEFAERSGIRTRPSPRRRRCPASRARRSWPSSARCRRRWPTWRATPRRPPWRSASSASGGRVLLQVRDDGRGFPAEPLEAYERRGHMGLAGMRERIGALGGSVRRSRRGGRRRAGRGQRSGGRRGAVVSEPVIRVLVADDHAIVRTGIRHVLEGEPGFEVVGEAATGAEALELAERLRPDVAVLDLSMPGARGCGSPRSSAGSRRRPTS